jgi:hypothetical protein
MTVLSVKQVRALGDELQRDPLQHANHAVSLLNCIKADAQEVRPCLRSCRAVSRNQPLPAAPMAATAAAAAVAGQCLLHGHARVAFKPASRVNVVNCCTVCSLL